MLDTGALNFYCFRFGNTDIIFDEKLVFPLNIYATNVHDKLVCSLVQGKWIQSSSWSTIVDPLNGEPFIKVAEVDKSEIKVHLGALICLVVISQRIFHLSLFYMSFLSSWTWMHMDSIQIAN